MSILTHCTFHKVLAAGVLSVFFVQQVSGAAGDTLSPPVGTGAVYHQLIRSMEEVALETGGRSVHDAIRRNAASSEPEAVSRLKELLGRKRSYAALEPDGAIFLRAELSPNEKERAVFNLQVNAVLQRLAVEDRNAFDAMAGYVTNKMLSDYDPVSYNLDDFGDSTVRNILALVAEERRFGPLEEERFCRLSAALNPVLDSRPEIFPSAIFGRSAGAGNAYAGFDVERLFQEARMRQTAGTKGFAVAWRPLGYSLIERLKWDHDFRRVIRFFYGMTRDGRCLSERLTAVLKSGMDGEALMREFARLVDEWEKDKRPCSLSGITIEPRQVLSIVSALDRYLTKGGGMMPLPFSGDEYVVGFSGGDKAVDIEKRTILLKNGYMILSPSNLGTGPEHEPSITVAKARDVYNAEFNRWEKKKTSAKAAYDGATTVKKASTFVDKVVEMCPERGSILEIGAGNGRDSFAMALHRPDCRITVTDVSPSLVAEYGNAIRQMGLVNVNHTVLKAPCNLSAIPSASYDVV
ncbi:MAG: class I SAM-dependent methyltransferase, partial [Candidatus Omnitrophica bacterium]|nr:class I SAM-dependent methyltransferase [Candidatus Omnitrophota bacterium]